MRYFIGYGLTGADAQAVRLLQEKIASEFGVHGALEYPPHITIFPPFEVDNVEPLKKPLEAFVKNRLPFSVQTPGFASFNQAVWFIDVAPKPELVDLKEKLVETVTQLGIKEAGVQHDTHFHLTLAFKQIPPDVFKRIGEFLKKETPPIHSVKMGALTLFAKQEDELWIAKSIFHFAAKLA